MTILLIISLCIFLHPSPCSSDTAWHPKLRFRRQLQVSPPSGNVTHLEEMFSMNTFELLSSNKLLSDCSDLAFGWVSVSSGNSDLEYISWWAETACPGTTPDSPNTIFWVSIPLEFGTDGSGDQLYVFYGGGGDSGSVSGDFRLGGVDDDWSSSQEIRLFVGDATSVSCPTLWQSQPSWHSFYPSIGFSEDMVIGGDPAEKVIVTNFATHGHTFRERTLACELHVGVNPIYPTSVCANDQGPPGSLTRGPHVHDNDATKTGVLTLDPNDQGNELYLDSFGVRPCVAPVSVGGVRAKNPYGHEVGIFREGLNVEDSWTFYGPSEDYYLRFAENYDRIQAPGSNVHTHGASAYVEDSYTLMEVPDVDNVQRSSGSGPNLGFFDEAGGHSHTLETLEFLDSIEIVPSHVRAFFFSKIRDDQTSESDDYVPMDSNRVLLFLERLPPLGYVELSEFQGHLVRGYPQTQFGNEGFHADSTTSTGRHKHSVDASVTQTSRDMLAGCFPTEVSALGECQGGEWDGFGYLCIGSHAHSCDGNSVVWPVFNSLPDHVPLLFAHRVSPERAISPTSSANEESGSGSSVGSYVGISLGIVFGVGVLVVVAIVVVVVVIVLLRKRAASGSSSSPEDLRFSEGLPTKGGGQFDKSLFAIEPKDVNPLQSSRGGRSGGSSGHGMSEFRASWKTNEVTVKYARPRMVGGTVGDVKAFERNLRLCLDLEQHPNVVRVYGCSLDFKIGLLLEYCENGSLEAYVKNCRSKKDEDDVDEDSPTSLTKKFELLMKVAMGLIHLHSHGIIHQDLCPLNILLDSEMNPKVTGFGVARLMKSAEKNGTPGYIAPEVFRGEEFDEKADVFSFAVVAYVLISGRWRPYRNTKGIDSRVASDPSYRPDLNDEIPSACQRLISSCWNASPDARPSFNAITGSLKLFQGGFGVN